jgi:predicted transposase/invertase (TIGR01784 family)
MKDRYINPFTDYRDLKNVIDTGREEGWEQGLVQGREEGRLEAAKQMARQMKAAGEPVAKIVAYTGLTADEIREL